MFELSVLVDEREELLLRVVQEFLLEVVEFGVGGRECHADERVVVEHPRALGVGGEFFDFDVVDFDFNSALGDDVEFARICRKPAGDFYSLRFFMVLFVVFLNPAGGDARLFPVLDFAHGDCDCHVFVIFGFEQFAC